MELTYVSSVIGFDGGVSNGAGVQQFLVTRRLRIALVNSLNLEFDL